MSSDLNPKDNLGPKKHHSVNPDLSASSMPDPFLLARDYFSGYVSYVFQTRLGAADPKVNDYMTDLLTRFIRLDNVTKMRDVRGRPLTSLVYIANEASARVGEARTAAFKHLGDVALYYSGFCPEIFKQNTKENPMDTRGYYLEQGKSAFIYLSRNVDNDRDSGLYQELGVYFEMFSYGLEEVKRTIENDKDPTAKLLIRLAA